jgi:tetraprenyl-beta-curcumene synthase
MSAETAITFTRAASSYWWSVHPRVRGEVERLCRRAGAIPQVRLRAIALGALSDKRSNIDGAAAFAAFAPAAHRAAVVRAQVSFQALYDYLDTLTEQPHHDPVLNSRRLHGALSAALDPSARGGASRGGAYYAHNSERDDGGYLQDTVESCQAALRTLPGYPLVRESAMRLGAHIVAYQSFNVTDARGSRAELARWATARTPPRSGLRWWETAAAAGSSLGLFALVTMAARPDTSAAGALAVERAYFPWIGALHSLLDSLIDRAEDEASGQHALVENYDSAAEMAARLRLLAVQSRRRAHALPDAAQHAAILASMASLYLAEPQASDPPACRARSEVLAALGPLAAPAMTVMRLRRLAL